MVHARVPQYDYSSIIPFNGENHQAMKKIL